MDLAIIADRDTLIGFKLAGIRDGALFEENKFKESVEKFKAAKILILTEQAAEFARQKKIHFGGVIVEIPDKKGGTGRARKELSRLFESAMGIKLKE